MRQFFSIFLTLGLWLASAQAEVKAYRQGRVLKVMVKPYAPLKPYELWYRHRRDGAGDRFGQREFWLNHPTQHEYYSFREACGASVNAGKLDLTINLDTPHDHAMWAKFNCLRLDNDAFTIVYPELEKFFTPVMTELRALNAKVNDTSVYTDYSAPDYQVKADAKQAIYQLVHYTFSSDFAWYKSAEYREALLKGSLKAFNKKSYAGHDPVITKPLVIVTHATTIFDNKTIKSFVDENLTAVKAKGLPVIYLVSDDGVHDQTWYLADRHPTQAYFSKNGEHSVLAATNQVVLMGGYYSQCLRTTQLDTITRHFLVSSEALTIHLPVKGIYAHDSIDFTQLTKQQFLERVKAGSILGGYEVDDNHGGLVESDMNKLTGVPNLSEYTVNIFTDDQLLEKVGSGARVVNLKFWSHNQFINFLN